MAERSGSMSKEEMSNDSGCRYDRMLNSPILINSQTNRLLFESPAWACRTHAQAVSVVVEEAASRSWFHHLSRPAA